jgi:hypothetical protein
MSIERAEASLGMTVMLSDGTKLGRVVRASEERLEVEGGFLFRKRYWVRFSDVDRESEGKLHLRLSRDGLSVNEPTPLEPRASTVPA